MGGSDRVVVGDRGRMVVPAEVRERAGIEEGTVLVPLGTPGGLALLLAERRAAAAADDAG